MKKLLIVSCLLVVGCAKPKDGKDGLSGNDGHNGHNSLVATSPADTSICTAGGTVIKTGLDENDNNILELSETQQVSAVCNGNDGKNGLNGSDGQDGNDAVKSQFDIAAIYVPCAKNPMNPSKTDISNINLEIMLKLENGLIVSSVSDNTQGKNTRFGVISNGTYQSTGSQSCIFTVKDGYIYN